MTRKPIEWGEKGKALLASVEAATSTDEILAALEANMNALEDGAVTVREANAVTSAVGRRIRDFKAALKGGAR